MRLVEHEIRLEAINMLAIVIEINDLAVNM